MQSLLEYKIQSTLYESNNTLVLRANGLGANPVILKVLKSESFGNEAIQLVHNEYNLISSLHSASRVINTHGLERDGDKLIMLLEDFGATSLDKLLNQTRFSIDQILDIAIAVLEGLDEIHGASIIHKNINPSNIVMNPDNGMLKLIDFGIASTISNKENILKNRNIVEGTLSYIPPEQTGRINRIIDHRADFYSFGATLYELLAHKPPFKTIDHLNLIHSHLAKKPIPLSDIRPEIPTMISKIVMKLMSKDAMKRYATAKGIKADLQKCLDFVKKSEMNFSFPIDNGNLGQSLKISQNLFGREKELKLLKSIFKEVFTGKMNTAFIQGPAGIGKTLLIQELEQYVFRNNGIFITGKFNSLHQSIPYTGITQALRQLARQLLTKARHELDIWQEKIGLALGNQGYEIIELVPEFEKILGPKSPVSGLGGHEARNRFYLMFENFIAVFARQKHPLVLFLDDLQWIDSSSLEFIKKIIFSPLIESLFIMGTFRDNEVPAGHPLHTLFKILKKKKVLYQNIGLAPLDVSDISKIIIESLGCHPDKAHTLAQWIHTRSQGNPFHAKELLAALNEQKKLTYDIQQRAWEWDLEKIQALTLPESIMELLAKKIQILSKATQGILMQAACIGIKFELGTLSIVCEQSRNKILTALEESMEAGLILSKDDTHKSPLGKNPTDENNIYKFIHDRIHAAAYNLMPRDQRLEFHWQTGQLLLRKLQAGQRDARIFEIVNHLNKGRSLLSYGPERKELANLNLKAAQKAKASTAFNQAYDYFKTGINLLESGNNPNMEKKKSPGNYWKESYELISTLYLGAIETAYLSTRFGEVERLGKTFISNAASLQDRLRFYSIKIQDSYAQNLMDEALSTALYALGLAGIHVSPKPRQWEIVLEYVKTSIQLSGKSMGSLSQIPTEINPEKLIVLNIMRNTLLPSYYVNEDLFPILVFKAIRISLRHGSSVDSAFAFAGYGMILAGVIGKLEKGYQFGCLAAQILKNFNTCDLGAKILVTVSTFTTHWKKHLKNVLPMLEEASEKGYESGDFEFTACAIHLDSYYRFFLGENIARLKKRGEANKKKIKKLKQKTMLLYQNMHLQTIFNLRKEGELTHKFAGPYYNEDLMMPIHIKAKDAGALFNFYLQKAIICFLFNYPEKAMKNINTAEKYLFSQRATTDEVVFCFFSSLSNMAGQNPGYGKKEKIKQVKKNLKKMKRWAKSAPMNYEHKYLLMEAEYSRLKNQPEKAADLYEISIERARENGYIHEAAIASELAGRFYLHLNNSNKAREYLKQAWNDYAQWGALAKLSQLKDCYPEVFSAQAQICKTSFDSTAQTIIHTPGELLDWAAVLKASVSISSEIHFEQLTEKLMEIITQNTGAQRGVLFLSNNLSDQSELKQAAVYPADPEQKKNFNSVDLEKCSQIPKSVIRYVERMKESILFDQGDTDPLFKNDPYIVARQPKSFLCFPLQHKSKLLGVFYLENNLISGTFTSNSLEGLKILSAQISVSLENARLYRDLNKQTQKLTTANKKLQKEIDHRCRIETELREYRDKLKKEFDAQARELLESKQSLAKIYTESNRKHRFQNIIGKSDQMQKIYELIEDLSHVNANVLITGESGTGKELVAQALHYSEKRKNLPFVRVNCSALSESLLESELFGHVKGAFTGADNNKKGRFQKAGKGSILLDEIGDVSLYFQKRLLRVLQEREFEQLGDTKTIQMNARIIASTNKDLAEKVKDQSFRKDLYYRLKVIEIKIPPLRERKEDIPLLINHFLSQFKNEMSKNITRISEDTYKMLMSYNWPGNIRELKNLLEHAVVTCKKSVITPENLPPDFDLMYKEMPPAISKKPFDKEKIIEALNKAKWNKTKAAKLLGISRRTLYRKLTLYSIE